MASTVANPDLSQETTTNPMAEAVDTINTVIRPAVNQSSSMAVPKEPMADAVIPKEKQTEVNAPDDKKRPLQLLDLPLDILKEIVKEVSQATTICEAEILMAIGDTHQRLDFAGIDTFITTRTCDSLHLF
jgi:hypothetical protein